MFFFLVAVVREDRPQFRVLAGIGTLVVPVDRFQFLNQRDDRPVHVTGFIRQLLDQLVVCDARHGQSPQRNSDSKSCAGR